jgi:hypothetical protein
MGLLFFSYTLARKDWAVPAKASIKSILPERDVRSIFQYFEAQLDKHIRYLFQNSCQ